MKRFQSFLLLSLFTLSLSMSSCYTLVHQVGDGAQSNVSTEKRQWYALFGLVPINEVDSKRMAGDAKDYTITTEHTFIDGLISAFTGIVTVSVKTVKVEK